MSRRIYVIKETKNPNFTESYYKMAKGLIQASSLGLNPKDPPDYTALTNALAKDKGASVAYELTFDGHTLTFDLRFGKGRKQLADAPLTFKSLEDRRRIMNQLYTYKLVDAKDVPPSAEEVAAKQKERDAAFKADQDILGRVLQMAYEKSVDDTPASDLPAFKAWARKKGHNNLVDLYEAVQKKAKADELGPTYLADGAPKLVKLLDARVRKSLHGKDANAVRPAVIEVLDKQLKVYQEALRKDMAAARTRLQAKVKSLDAEIGRMTKF